MKNFEHSRFTEMKSAQKQLKSGATAYAGGTDLLDLMKSGIESPSALVDLKSLSEPEFRGIGFVGDSLQIGALTPIAELAGSSLLREQCPALQQAAASVASPQLRNMGTVGGNLCQRPRCWYFRDTDFDCLRKGGDTCFAVGGENRFHCVIGGGPCYIVHPSDLAVALTATDAAVLVRRANKTRTIPIGELFVLPEVDPTREISLESDEIITGIRVPKSSLGSKSGYKKFRFRDVWDFAVVSVAVFLESSGGQIRRGRVAFGGVAPVPWLDSDASAMLRGAARKPLFEAVARAALSDADPMEKNGYKLPLARNLLRRMIEELSA